MAPLPERLTVSVDDDHALTELRALAEKWRQIVADLRELRGKPADVPVFEFVQHDAVTKGGLGGLRTEISDPHGAFDRWRSLETDPAPMDGTAVLLAAFIEDGERVDPFGILVWACAAEWSELSAGWCPLLPDSFNTVIGGAQEYPPTHWRPI